jgi:4-amino-4-deoxy-L-arabinose transferase-like glycosyltransferase
MGKGYDIVKYILLAGLMYMPIFGHLDTLPIRIWDEARLAINAYEMSENGNLIVTHFEGKPDMWNTKPPLMIWLQTFFMKMLGANELAVRLPSAIAAFLTCLALLVFSMKYLQNFWFGFIVVLILITSHGYINIHATRTGDYDALLTLFTTLEGLFFFSYIETRKVKFLYLFFISMALAVLTKSVTGLMFLPAFLIYAIIRKQFLPVLKNEHFYIALLTFVIPVFGYYALREYYNPGYIAAVMENELGGRYFKVIENHHQGFWYYYNNFIDFQFTAWYLFVPAGLVVGMLVKNQKLKRLTAFSFWMIITFFLVISTAKTKLEWYDVPLYPYLSILVALFIHYIFDTVNNYPWFKKTLNYNIMPYIFLFLITIQPYRKIIDKTYLPKEYPWDKEFYEISYFLKDAVKGKYHLHQHYLVYDGYYAHLLFYLNVLNNKGIEISLKDKENLQPGDLVIVSQNHIKQYIEEHYKFDIKDTIGTVSIYKIYERKE